MEERIIGDIDNYYGGLNVAKSEDGKFYWGIVDVDGIKWEEIPLYLYDALNKYEDERSQQVPAVGH